MCEAGGAEHRGRLVGPRRVQRQGVREAEGKLPKLFLLVDPHLLPEVLAEVLVHLHPPRDKHADGRGLLRLLGSSCPGSAVDPPLVRLAGLQARPDLNGEIGVALRFVEKSRRWEVRLSNGEGKQLKPANLEPLSHAGGRVLAFWGDAQWSRTQLLGEIARGHWGLCRASVAELTADVPERWAALTPRLVFAPETEMMEDSIRESRRHSDAGREMQRQRDEMERRAELRKYEHKLLRPLLHTTPSMRAASAERDFVPEAEADWRSEWTRGEYAPPEDVRAM